MLNMVQVCIGRCPQRLLRKFPEPAAFWLRCHKRHCITRATTDASSDNWPYFASATGPLASVLAARRALQTHVPAQQFPIVGVSFENRQESVKQLRPGQGLLFVREPNNPHDANAVAVHTTGGVQLGYVPRDLTHHFLHERVPGHVRGVTLNSESLHGARVLVRPSLPGVLLQQLPASLWARGCTELETLLGPADFAQLRDQVLAAAGFRCEVTGLGAAEGTSVGELKLSPVWRVDEERRVAVLVRRMAVCDAVYQAERLLDPARGLLALDGAGGAAVVPEGVQRVAELVQDVNFWRMQDIWEYFRHCQSVQEQLSAEAAAWEYDLGG